MTTITTIAQRILDENNYTTRNITTTKLEYLIDNAIDYINMEAGKSIADLSGTVGSKSLVGTEAEIVTVKWLTVLLLRAYLDRGPNVSVQGLTVNALLLDPQYAFYDKYVEKQIRRLCGTSFERVS